MRKILLLVIGILGAIAGVFGKEFGLSLNPQAVTTTLIAAIVYIFGEARLDMERIRKGLIQEGKWKDPAFWTAIVAAVIPVLNDSLGINLPADTIAMILTFILGIIFKAKHKEITGG